MTTARTSLSVLVIAAAVGAGLMLWHSSKGSASPKNTVASSLTAAAPAAASISTAPVYVHMDGANAFVEPVVAVMPGEPVVFVNEDTGMHMIDSYDPLTGKPTKYMLGVVQGTTGPKGKIDYYKVTFKHPGVYYYYCPVHAVLSNIYHHSVQPSHRPGVHGFPGAMAGLIVVTSDKSLLSENPPTSHKRILSDYFGG